MNIVVCDDENVYLNAISDACKEWACLHDCEQSIMIHTFNSSEDMFAAWQKGMPVDLLFLDIQIPGEMDGLEIAKRIRMQNDQIIIVFITNYAEYACDGYFVNALRYLKKPITPDQINECLDISYKRWSLAQTSSFIFSSGKQTIVLPYSDILYGEVRGHTLFITLSRGNEILEVRGRMVELLHTLPKELFVQCNRSFIANLMYIRRFTKILVTMSDNKEIPLGRKFSAVVATQFDRYYQGMTQ